jgi:hypothetical protein
MPSSWSYLIDESNYHAREALDSDLRVVLQHRALCRLRVSRPKSPTITYQGGTLPINRDVMDQILSPTVTDQTLTCEFGGVDAVEQSICVLTFNNTQVIAEHGGPTMVRKLRKTANRSELPFTYADFYKWSYPPIIASVDGSDIVIEQLTAILDRVTHMYVLQNSTMMFVPITQDHSPRSLLYKVRNSDKLVLALGTPIHHLIQIKRGLINYVVTEYQHSNTDNYVTDVLFKYFNPRVEALWRVTPAFWDRYTICGDVLGEGSYGAVYSVSDAHGSIYAAKIGDVAKVRHDGEILQTLNHPGVVQYHSTFLIPPTPRTTLGPVLKAVVLMERVPGVDLDTWATGRYGNATTRDATDIIPIFASALAAVMYLHRNGVFHQDLKPENIMVTPNNTAVLIDFGFACWYRDLPPLGARTVVKGSTNFMPPEFFSSNANTSHTKNLYPKADIFSLGATFYAIFTGSVSPWIGEKDKVVGFSFSKLHRVRLALTKMQGPLPLLISAMLDPDPVTRPTADAVYQEVVHPSQTPQVGEKA